jgi:hypothetical protein
VEFPRFDEDNVSGWLFKANQFFSFSNTPNEYKEVMFAFYIKGNALMWFQYESYLGLLTSWDAFDQAIQLQFGPKSYDDPMEALTRLRQIISISIYKIQFEKLSNRLKRSL